MRYTLSSFVDSRITRHWAVCLLVAVLAEPEHRSFGADEPKVANAEEVRKLIRQLGSEDFEEREQAGKKLVALGRPVLKALEVASGSKEVEIARRARECMFRIDPSLEIKPQVMAWIKQLRSADKKERDQAGTNLGELGPKLTPFLPALVEVLDDPSVEVRFRVVCLLRREDSIAEMALPKLMRILKDKTSGTDSLRWEVLSTLETMGAAARQAIPLLLQILEADEPLMQKGAMHTLMELSPKDARIPPALWKVMSQSKDWDVQYNASCYLAQFHWEPEKHIPVLLQMLRTRAFKGAEGANDERGLIRSLGQYGPLAEPAIPYLIQSIKDVNRDESVQEEAIKVLIRIGPTAHKMVPGLKNLKEPITPTERIEIARKIREK